MVISLVCIFSSLNIQDSQRMNDYVKNLKINVSSKFLWFLVIALNCIFVASVVLRSF